MAYIDYLVYVLATILSVRGVKTIISFGKVKRTITIMPEDAISYHEGQIEAINLYSFMNKLLHTGDGFIFTWIDYNTGITHLAGGYFGKDGTPHSLDSEKLTEYFDSAEGNKPTIESFEELAENTWANFLKREFAKHGESLLKDAEGNYTLTDKDGETVKMPFHYYVSMAIDDNGVIAGIQYDDEEDESTEGAK